MRNTVVVFGSLNMDLVVRVPHMPRPGETLGGRSFFTDPGGKGANQAVASARQGARVEMVGRIGSDAFGAELMDSLAREGIGISGVVETPDQATGIAMIMVDDEAQNCIAVVPGANGCVTEGDADAMDSIMASAAMLLLQLEVPMAAVVRAARTARRAGCRVLLNPAPMLPLSVELLSLVDILVVNEIEAGMLCGMAEVTPDNAAQAAASLLDLGPRDVIVTLGEHGVVCASAQGVQVHPAVRVQAIDTTAAGDTFIGALTALLVEGCALPEAVHHATHAAALCVTRVGAQASMPSRQEVVQSLSAT